MSNARNVKNPGIQNQEARKAERGGTFVGFRPVRFKNKKTYDRKRERSVRYGRMV